MDLPKVSALEMLRTRLYKKMGTHYTLLNALQKGFVIRVRHLGRSVFTPSLNPFFGLNDPQKRSNRNLAID